MELSIVYNQNNNNNNTSISKESEESLEKYFYYQCIKKKLLMNNNSTTKNISIFHLYQECISKNIPADEWSNFINAAFHEQN